MKSLRPLLSSVLGLVLLVQGVAVASAPHGLLSRDAAAAQDSAAAEMPCHRDAQTPDPVDTGTCACCDGDCPNMSGCAFGHLAAVPAIKLQVAPVEQAVIAARDRSAETVALPFRLRPPISHA